jgi:hypothetical protein
MDRAYVCKRCRGDYYAAERGTRLCGDCAEILEEAKRGRAILAVGRGDRLGAMLDDYAAPGFTTYAVRRFEGTSCPPLRVCLAHDALYIEEATGTKGGGLSAQEAQPDILEEGAPYECDTCCEEHGYDAHCDTCRCNAKGGAR